MKPQKATFYLRKFRNLSLLCVVSVVVTAIGCAGTMRGFIREGCDPVEFQFTDNGYDGGDLVVTLPDGENYKGSYKYNMSTTYGYGYGTGYTYSGSYTPFGITSIYASTTDAGLVEAKLGGSKGHLMECQFIKQYQGESLATGGNGLCKTSNGHVIDVMWIGTSVSKLQKNEVLVSNENSVRLLENGIIFYIPTATKWEGDAVYHVEETKPGEPQNIGPQKYWKLKITGYVGHEVIK